MLYFSPCVNDLCIDLYGGDGGPEIIIKLGKRVPREKPTPAYPPSSPSNIINSFNVPHW